MKRLFIFGGAMMLFLGSILAQEVRITGTVTDAADGSTLPGATVVVKGTTHGTVTNMDGEYEITADANAILVISYIGMQPKEEPVNSRTIINVSLRQEMVGLSEVVVVAYGTTRRESFTGSASVVGSDKLEGLPVTSVEQALSGAAPGIQVGNTSGQPGSALEIRVRGTGSISSSNEPLFVIDGIPVMSGSLSMNTSYGGNALSSLNPNDIESITILKDAAAASVYGSRAANGVVLITTKRGKEGATRFKYSTQWGYNNLAVDFYPLASVQDNYDVKKEGFFNFARFYQGMDESEAQAYAQAQMENRFADFDPNRPASDYDWQNELFRNGASMSHELSASGGTDKTRFFTSLSYLDQEGYALTTDYRRITGRLNLDHQANDIVSFGLNTSFVNARQRGIEEGDGPSFTYVNPIFASQFYLSPLFPVRNEDGSFNENIVNGSRPNLPKDLLLNGLSNNLFRNSSKLFADFSIMEGLNFRTTFGMDIALQDEDRYWSPLSNDGETHKGYAHKQHRILSTLTSSNIVTYNTSISDMHNLDILAGFEAEAYKDEKTSAEASNFPNATLPAMTVAADPLSANNWWDERKLLSFLSRVNYDFNNQVYLAASYRRDGSSVLGANERWGDFYSVSAAWRLTSMGFMESAPQWLSDWKLRASYGTNGTLPTDFYGHMGLYDYGFDYNGAPGMRFVQVPNPDLSWEKNNVINLGTDVTLFDRITLDLEYYKRNTKDLLLLVPVSRVTGFASTWRNIGEMENHGFEFALNSTNYAANGFVWTSSLNLSHNTNKIVKLYEGEDIMDAPYLLREGYSINTVYLREWAGVDPEDGMGLWYTHDEDGNRTGTTKDRLEATPQILGSTDPILTGGLHNSLRWNNFDISFLFNFSIGGKMIAHGEYFYNDDGEYWFSAVTQRQVDNRWQKPGDKAESPRYVFNNPQETNFMSSRRVFDNDFLRLKNLTFGYTLPQSFTRQAGFDSVRLYFTGYNLLTFATVDFMDPEVSVRGLHAQRLPAMRTLSFGLDVNF